MESEEDRLIREIRFHVGDCFNVDLESQKALKELVLIITISHKESKEAVYIGHSHWNIKGALKLTLETIKDLISEEITFENYFNKWIQYNK